jgi:hypothetical protein
MFFVIDLGSSRAQSRQSTQPPGTFRRVVDFSVINTA